MVGHEKIRLAEELADRPSAAIIIHRRIPLVSMKVFGAIAPIFRKDIGVWIHGFYFKADFGPKFLIKLNFVVTKKNMRLWVATVFIFNRLPNGTMSISAED